MSQDGAVKLLNGDVISSDLFTVLEAFDQLVDLQGAKDSNLWCNGDAKTVRAEGLVALAVEFPSW